MAASPEKPPPPFPPDHPPSIPSECRAECRRPRTTSTTLPGHVAARAGRTFGLEQTARHSCASLPWGPRQTAVPALGSYADGSRQLAATRDGLIRSIAALGQVALGPGARARPHPRAARRDDIAAVGAPNRRNDVAAANGCADASRRCEWCADASGRCGAGLAKDIAALAQAECLGPAHAPSPSGCEANRWPLQFRASRTVCRRIAARAPSPSGCEANRCGCSSDAGVSRTVYRRIAAMHSGSPQTSPPWHRPSASARRACPRPRAARRTDVAAVPSFANGVPTDSGDAQRLATDIAALEQAGRLGLRSPSPSPSSSGCEANRCCCSSDAEVSRMVCRPVAEMRSGLTNDTAARRRTSGSTQLRVKASDPHWSRWREWLLSNPERSICRVRRTTW